MKPVKIKPDPGVPAQVLEGGLMPVVPQAHPSLGGLIDLTLDSPRPRRTVEVIEILD